MILINPIDLKSDLIYLKQREGTKGLRIWLQFFGAKYILPSAGDINAVRKIIKEVGYNKQQIYRFMRKFKRLTQGRIPQ